MQNLQKRKKNIVFAFYLQTKIIFETTFSYGLKISSSICIKINYLMNNNIFDKILWYIYAKI